MGVRRGRRLALPAERLRALPETVRLQLDPWLVDAEPRLHVLAERQARLPRRGPRLAPAGGSLASRPLCAAVGAAGPATRRQPGGHHEAAAALPVTDPMGDPS